MTRTRWNGENISAQGILDDAIRLGESIEHRPVGSPVDAIELHELQRDISELIFRERRDAFNDGLQLGSKVEHRVAVEALQVAALAILGKDRGDGAIDLGALGREVFAPNPPMTEWEAEVLQRKHDQHRSAEHLDGAVPTVHCECGCGEVFGYHAGHEGPWYECTTGLCKDE